MNDEPREHRFSLYGLDFHATEWRPKGPPAGTALLLHGLFDAGSSWSEIAAALADAGLRAVAPDLRGFGDSGRLPPGASYNFFDMIRDTAALVDKFAEGERVLLLGHSLGGLLAIEYAASHPERVRALGLVETTGFPNVPESAGPDLLRLWIDAYRSPKDRDRAMSPDEALARLRSNHPYVPDEALRARAEHLTRPLPEGGWAWKFDPRHKILPPLGPSAHRWEAFGARVRAPTLLFLAGGARPPEEAQRIAGFADARTITIPSGHMLHWSHPAEIASAFLDFARPHLDRPAAGASS